MNSKFSRLQQALNLAVNDALYWEEACNAAIELVEANGVILVPTNPAFRGVWMSCSTYLKTTLGEYIEEGWHLRDPREQVTTLMLQHGHATDDDIFPDRTVKAEIPFYKQFLYKYNFGVLTAVRITTPNGYWGMMLHYSNDHPSISLNELSVIKKIRTMFETAAKQANEIAYKRISEFAQFFKGTESEVFVFDAHGNQCLNIDNQGKIKTQNRLSSLLPKEISNKLDEQLKEVLTSDASISLSKAYQFKESGSSINVLVIQIPPNLRHYFMPFKACAIRTECTSMIAIKQKRLQDEYLLSDTEVSTVQLLSSGKTPNMIANLLSLKVTSIRQRLKLIYEKTNVGSQVELIALYNQI